MEPTRKGIQLPLLGGKDIFIPSVPRLEDAQSVDSRSLDTAGMLSVMLSVMLFVPLILSTCVVLDSKSIVIQSSSS